MSPGRTHALLARDAQAGRTSGRGNLTISFLSLNRATLSITLLHSIRDQLTGFTGRVLIIDNGSEPAELATLRAGCAELPFATRIVELGRNFGVAGGRDRMMAQVETDWVLCLDNDIYFTSNPLPAIQRDLAALGCHFLNVPLLDRDGKTLFARGGHLYLSVDEAGIRIGAGSVFPQTVFNGTALPGFLSTFLFGGASVINKHTFAELGGYDEGMFIGFEDIDFSIRLFRAGESGQYRRRWSTSSAAGRRMTVTSAPFREVLKGSAAPNTASHLEHRIDGWRGLAHCR